MKPLQKLRSIIKFNLSGPQLLYILPQGSEHPGQGNLVNKQGSKGELCPHISEMEMDTKLGVHNVSQCLEPFKAQWPSALVPQEIKLRNSRLGQMIMSRLEQAPTVKFHIFFGVTKVFVALLDFLGKFQNQILHHMAYVGLMIYL